VKDVTKNSDKATRFLPVDMKDRLKTIFNRAPSRSSATADDDIPDYSAIFNANKAPGQQKKVRFNGPLEPPQLAEPPARATMKQTGMQRADEIEEAEIVPEQTNEPLVRAEYESEPSPAIEAAAPQGESFAQRAAAKAKALAANAGEALSGAGEALKSRVASVMADSSARETDSDEQESLTHREQPRSQTPAAHDEESFAYRGATSRPKPAEEDSFAHRAAPKAKVPAASEDDSFAHRAAPRAKAPAASEDDSFAHRAAPRKPEPKVEERKPEPRATKAEERKPDSQFTSEMWKSHESERKADERKPERRAEEPRAQAEESEHDDAGLESRFGRLSSSEHVRLKVDPRRSEQRREQERQEEPAPVMASSGQQHAPEPARPYRETPESKPRNTEEHMAAGFAHESKPLEQPRETYRGSGEATPPRASASERSNLHQQNQQKETSMYAKGQQESHDNGTATVRSEGANLSSIAIERNSKFSGQLKFSGAIAIDGQVEGELVAERVVVHEGGTVNATIEGNTVVVAGTVKGDIYARAELEVLPSGVIHGSVTTPAINVRRGGRIDGRCTIGAPRQ
jgi:cytoskeletal protein CcmA (bactofilin family)